MEARDEFLGDRSTTDEVTPFEDQRSEPCPRQVGTVDEPVVPATDDDRVVGGAVAHGRHAVFLGGLKNGVRTTCAPTVSVRWSTVISSRSGVPTVATSGRTRAIPM